MSYDVQTKELPDVLALNVSRTVSMATIGQAVGEAFMAIAAHAQASGARLNGPPFCVYPDLPEDEFEVRVCMPVASGAEASADVSLDVVPGGVAASTLHRGPYSAIGESYEALGAWIALNGFAPTGPPREVYLNDPGSVPESELLTEVLWPYA